MKLIEQFECCTLPKSEWTHTNHFVVALWYCLHFPLPEAVQKIRAGIKAYNVSVGGQNTEDSGYHETITLFYVNAVAEYIIKNGVHAVTEEALTAFLDQPFILREYIYQFYSKEVLMSKEARMGWKAPDKYPSSDIFLKNLLTDRDKRVV
jgi:hypothetical protein